MARRLDDDDILQWIHAESLARRRRLDTFIRASGHAHLADELQSRLREVDLGVYGARATWNSISEPQRRVLALMSKGRTLVRSEASRSRYDADGAAPIIGACGIATARNLCGRDLIHCDGTAFDPESRFVLTERGRFVLRHGPSHVRR